MITTKSDGTKVVHNGYGTVRYGAIHRGNNVEIIVCEGSPKSIGTRGIIVKPSAQVILSFCNVNSIDAVISELNRAKAMLQGKAL